MPAAVNLRPAFPGLQLMRAASGLQQFASRYHWPRSATLAVGPRRSTAPHPSRRPRRSESADHPHWRKRDRSPGARHSAAGLCTNNSSNGGRCGDIWNVSQTMRNRCANSTSTVAKLIQANSVPRNNVTGITVSWEKGPTCQSSVRTRQGNQSDRPQKQQPPLTPQPAAIETPQRFAGRLRPLHGKPDGTQRKRQRPDSHSEQDRRQRNPRAEPERSQQRPDQPRRPAPRFRLATVAVRGPE